MLQPDEWALCICQPCLPLEVASVFWTHPKAENIKRPQFCSSCKEESPDKSPLLQLHWRHQQRPLLQDWGWFLLFPHWSSLDWLFRDSLSFFNQSLVKSSLQFRRENWNGGDHSNDFNWVIVAPLDTSYSILDPWACRSPEGRAKWKPWQARIRGD